MNTNQQTNISNISNEQNRFVELDQGSAIPIAGRIYKNYNFIPITESKWDEKISKEYAEIAKEFINILSENRVVSFEVPWKKTRVAKEDFLGRWKPPIFIEDGRMQELKQELKTNKWGKQLWADYMWYEQRKTKTLFLRLDSIIRFYFRDIVVIQREIEKPLLERMEACGWEIGSIGVTIFPHADIKYQENDRETIHSYYHTDDFFVYVAYDLFSADITIELNNKYISYEQMLEIIEPLFEKRGIKIKDKTDPYIYANYPPDYVEHNEYPCAGYQFFD